MTSRRDFLMTVAATPALLRLGADHAVVVRGGTVYDGLGGEGMVRDVAIANGRIVAIAPRVAELNTHLLDDASA